MLFIIARAGLKCSINFIYPRKVVTLVTHVTPRYEIRCDKLSDKLSSRNNLSPRY